MSENNRSANENSPRIKGIALLEVVKGLRLHRDAARSKLPEAQHRYLDLRIEIGDWYPEADHIALMRAVAELFGPPGLDAWRWMGRQRATLDFREIFAERLHSDDPAASLLACQQIWPLYRDSGRVETALAAAAPHRLCLIDYPYTNAEMVRLFTGYLEVVLELSGLHTFEIQEPEEWAPSCAEWIISWPATD